MSPIQTTVLRALLGLVVVVAAPQDVFAQEFQALSASVPAPTAVTTPLAMRAMALPDAERLYNIRESRLADHHRQGPLQELAPAALARLRRLRKLTPRR